VESANYILQQPAFPLIWTALGGLRFSLARTCIGSSDYSLKGGFDDTYHLIRSMVTKYGK
jgi:hypothetical protein